jgi:hypothetical protein
MRLLKAHFIQSHSLCLTQFFKKLTMNLRIALVSICAVLGGLALGVGNAHAQSVDIDFDGTVGPTCAITAPVNGVLKIQTTPADATRLSSDPTRSTGASRGSFTMNCTAGANILMTIPTVRAGSATAATIANYAVGLFDGTTLIASAIKGGTIGSTAITGPINNKVFSLDMGVSNGATPLPNGPYLYRVNIAVTPQ